MNSNDSTSKVDDRPGISSASHAELTPFQADMAGYRRLLLTNESAMQTEFDKYILTLSSGALALSITFLKEVLNQQWVASGWLNAAWISWAASICGMVFSFFTSAKAMRTAVTQADDMLLFKEANDGNLGGHWNKATKLLNFLGGLSFLIGVVCMVKFTATNLNPVASTASKAIPARPSQTIQDNREHKP